MKNTLKIVEIKKNTLVSILYSFIILIYMLKDFSEHVHILIQLFESGFVKGV